MCTLPPQTEKNIGQPAAAAGLQCPLCESGSALGYMKFRDPHGVDRVDPGLFECAAKRHSYTLAANGAALRLLAADGARPWAKRQFRPDETGRLVEDAAAS